MRDGTATPMGRWRAPAARCLDMAARGAVPSAAWRDALFVLFIAGILAYGAAFAWYMLARFDLINLIRDASNDDAFYYFQIARNLAEGKFSTFDGGITHTNGYHPLWLFLITPFYWVFDKEAALFAIKAFEIMLVAGGVALVAVAARLARMPWVLMFAALPMLYHIRALFRGLEAAAALFMLGLFILAVCLFARSPARWKWPLAAVAFALPWVRLEYIAISLAATAALCLIEWSWRERAPGARARSALSVKAVVPFLAAGASILVYFAYNRLVFGGIVPVSGATKAAWSRFLWERDGGYSLAQNFQEVLQVHVFGYVPLLVMLEVCALFPLVLWFARRSRSREDWLLLAFLAGVSGLAAGHLAKFVQTVLTVHPFIQGAFAWYFVPAYLTMALIVPVNCGAAVHFVRRFIEPKSHRAANIVSLGVVLAGAAFLGTVFLFTRFDFTGPFQFVESRSKATFRHGHLNFYMGTLVMNRVLPEDSMVGSWDSGIIGYFSRFPVVNLDGLANSYDYFHATNVDRDGYADWDGEFIPLYRKFGITHFANLTRQGFEGRVLFEGLPNTRGQAFHLWPIEPPEDNNAAAWVWKRMEPHFDHQSDGVGLIVDGRLAQTFAGECDPDELAVWSWAGPGEETVAKAWTQTQTGSCVSAVVLPHDALLPVRVETVPETAYAPRLAGDSPPVIRSDWDVHLVGNSLVYVKEQCGLEDVDASFFIYLDPVGVNNLLSHRKQYSFDNLDFAFRDHGFIEGGVCVARRELPDYAIAAISTGQFVRENGGVDRLWKGEIRLNE